MITVSSLNWYAAYPLTSSLLANPASAEGPPHRKCPEGRLLCAHSCSFCRGLTLGQVAEGLSAALVQGEEPPVLNPPCCTDVQCLIPFTNKSLGGISVAGRTGIHETITFFFFSFLSRCSGLSPLTSRSG